MFCDKLEGRNVMGKRKGFRRERTYIHLWLTHVDVWQRPTQYCEAIFLQLNKFRGKKREEKKKKT